MPGIKCRLRLPSLRQIDFVSPRYLHIPRILSRGRLSDYELHTIAAVLAAVEARDGSFVDVGANIGIFSLCVADALGRHCRAYEPFSDAADVAADLLTRLGLDIDLRRAAVGREPGRATFFLSSRSDMSNSLNAAFRTHRGQVDVEVTSLDADVADLPIAVVKIDTETTEPDVVAGALRTLERCRPAVVVELLSAAVADAVFQQLQPLGYQPYHINDQPRLRSVSNLHAADFSGERNWLFWPGPLTINVIDRMNKWRARIAAL